MTYTLFPSSPMCNSLILGPIKYCGYVPLLNDLGNNNNCKSLIGIVHGRLRVVIYSFKSI